MATSTKNSSATYTTAELMADVAAFDKNRTAQKTRHASFKSAQQNGQSAQGISTALKIGFALSVALIVLVIAI